MTGPVPARSATSSDRLQRLLALVPYVVSRKVVGLGETAAAFGVSERELVDDLNMLWCVELRAPDPYCPIDLSYEGGEIMVSQAESMDRPLRLGVDEASALLVALRMLAELGQAGGSAVSPEHPGPGAPAGRSATAGHTVTAGHSPARPPTGPGPWRGTARPVATGVPHRGQARVGHRGRLRRAAMP